MESQSPHKLQQTRRHCRQLRCLNLFHCIFHNLEPSQMEICFSNMAAHQHDSPRIGRSRSIIAKPSAGEGGESKCPELFQARQDSPAVRFLEKGESSRAGLRPDPSAPLPADPMQHVHNSPDAAPGSPEKDLAAIPLLSPAGICQDRLSPDIAQVSAPECVVAESPEVAQGEFVKSADFQCHAELYPRQTSPASDSVCAGEWPSSPAAPVSYADSGENLQGQLLLEEKRQSLSGGVLGFAGVRPRLPEFKSASDPASPVTFQHCQRPPVSEPGLSTVPVCPPSLSEPLGKGPDLQSCPGELSVAVNSENMDDALCSVLMSSHDGEDEGRLTVQPLNVLYPSAENELVFPDWVIKCAERIHSRVGITYIGHKWQFMALLTFIEKERMKELEAQSPSVSKKNREIKNLENSINYDNRGEGQSSRGKRKGRGSKVV
jgi:hypothetical protein